MKRVLLVDLTLSLVAVAGVTAQARAPWGPVAAREVSLELVRPVFDDVNLSLTSFVLYPRVRVPTSPTVAVVCELAVARLGGSAGSAGIRGNPYLGLEWAAPGGLEAGAGVRFPIGEGSFLTAFGDFDRFEAWTEDTWALSGWVGRHSTSPGGFQVGVVVGVTALRSNVAGADTEAFADYRVTARYGGSRLAPAAQLTGRYLLTESGNIDELTFHQLSLGVGAGVGRVWPSVAIRLPIDADLRGIIDLAVELGIVVPF